MSVSPWRRKQGQHGREERRPGSGRSNPSAQSCSGEGTSGLQMLSRDSSEALPFTLLSKKVLLGNTYGFFHFHWKFCYQKRIHFLRPLAFSAVGLFVYSL